MEAKEVKAFFEWVASDGDTMRLAYYDERVIEKMAEVSGSAKSRRLPMSAPARALSPRGSLRGWSECSLRHRPLHRTADSSRAAIVGDPHRSSHVFQRADLFHTLW
jgi:hypothetical protein